VQPQLQKPQESPGDLLDVLQSWTELRPPWELS
jgi:hypothetical protein